MSLLDKFLYKFAMVFFLLFSVVVLDKINVIDFSDLQEKMSTHFNFLKLINKINGKTTLIAIDLDEVQSANAGVIKSQKITNGNRIILDSYEAVESLDLGIVVRIEKDSVYILNNDDYLYCYTKLETVDVNLYQIVRKNQIIGKASADKNGINYYDVYVKKNNKYVDLGI
ncbi:MAG TPA: M23 family metallopeptidase [Acholeplasmataceae bacterium]|nr:M23 family metallopeptidase [Acholeplasmataceae bacterium]